MLLQEVVAPGGGRLDEKILYVEHTHHFVQVISVNRQPAVSAFVGDLKNSINIVGNLKSDDLGPGHHCVLDGLPVEPDDPINEVGRVLVNAPLFSAHGNEKLDLVSLHGGKILIRVAPCHPD